MNETTTINLTDSEAEYLITAIDFTRKGEWFWQISPNPEAFGPQTLNLWHDALNGGHRCLKATVDEFWVLFRLVSDFTPKGERKASADAIEFWNTHWDAGDSIAEKLIPVVNDRRKQPKAAKKAAKAAPKATPKQKQPKAVNGSKAATRKSREAPSKNNLIATLIRQNQQIIELLQAA